MPAGQFFVVACFFAIIIIFYFLFSLPISYIKHNNLDYNNAEQLK